jgi:GntR family transcriptional regulator/MocR family aminotransferase
MGTVGLRYPLDLIALKVGGATPLNRQLCDQLRELILSGAVSPGARLPSIRGAAAALGISRNTVIAALDQLSAEGLIETRQGSGTRVSPAMVIHQAGPEPGVGAQPNFSARGKLMSDQPRVTTLPGRIAFHPGTPELELFPFKTWSRILSRHARFGRDDLFGYHYISGHPHLREMIAGFLRVMRRVRCVPEQVVVTTGGQAALDLLARLLIDPGDTVWMEEPGYIGARGAFLAAGAKLVPLSVGRDGWRAPEAGPPPRLIYLTPACQHPLSITMPLDQRLAILRLAQAAGAWIIEDDFDGEYTFRGQPQPSMQGLIGDARVIYVGTFAKTLFPAMRLGFMVMPPDLAERTRPALSVTGQFAPLVLQAALADFIEQGYFFRHLNRMRHLYSRRRMAFVSLFAQHLSPWLEPIDGRTGIQIASTFHTPCDDRAVAAAARAAGVNLAPLSLYFAGQPTMTGLLMGYAAVAETSMLKAFEILKPIVAAAESPGFGPIRRTQETR